jgi:hypothetical protein
VALQPPTQTSLEIFTARRLSSAAIGVSVEKKLFTVQQAPFQIDASNQNFTGCLTTNVRYFIIIPAIAATVF